MRIGHIYTYYGEGKGKTTLAVGQGLRAVGEGLTVIMIQYLNYNETKEFITLKKIEADFKVFCFEKKRPGIKVIDEETEKEIQSEIKNAFNFSKKILETGECDMLILDGIIEAVTRGFISEDDLCEILDKKQSYMDVIITGSKIHERLTEKSDYVFEISPKKVCEN